MLIKFDNLLRLMHVFGCLVTIKSNDCYCCSTHRTHIHISHIWIMLLKINKNWSIAHTAILPIERIERTSFSILFIVWDSKQNWNGSFDVLIVHSMRMLLWMSSIQSVHDNVLLLLTPSVANWTERGKKLKTKKCVEKEWMANG